MSSGPERHLSVLAVALAASLFACGSVDEADSLPPRSGEEPARPSPAPTGGTSACTPSVGLTERAGEPMGPLACPAGWTERERKSSLPLSGRFTTAHEVVEAFCTRTSADVGEDDIPSIGIDFTESDVLAVATDGDVGLYRRGGDVWIRETTSACAGDVASFRSVLFLVPKSRELREQYCSVPCG